MIKPAVVCLHGLGGTPHSVLPVTAAIHAAGYRTVAPMLPGHGTTPIDLIDVRWQDWLAAVVDVVDHLDDPPGGVALVGQSMGATLALHTATLRTSVVGVAAINALVTPPDPDTTEHLLHLLDRGRTMQPGGDPDLRDPNAHDTAYGELPLRSLLELGVGATTVHSMLASIAVPVFVVSSDHDCVVDPAQSEVLATNISGRVTCLRLPNSGHVAALDFDRDTLCAELLTWLATLTDSSAAPG